MTNLYFVQGIAKGYIASDLFVFKLERQAKLAKKIIEDFYDSVSVDCKYEIKKVNITQFNIKNQKLYCIVGRVNPLETQTWVFDTEAKARKKKAVLRKDPNRFVDALFYITEIYLNNLDTIKSIRDFVEEYAKDYEDDEEDW